MNEYELCNNGIITFEILDQCRLKECFNKGPVISAEKCVCILMETTEENDFGRVILPDRPIYVPQSVYKVKIESDSLETTKMKVIDISRSKVKKDYWDIEICFTFTFKIQLFDFNMKKLKVLCREQEGCSQCEGKNIKDYILGSVECVQKVTLHGQQPEFPLIASDIFAMSDGTIKNSPHVLAEAKAYFVDVTLKTPEDVCLYEKVLDDIYDEPIIYIYITIGIFMLVKLFRLASILVESQANSIARPCCDTVDKECCLFNQLEFPYDDFLPPSNLED